MALAKQGRNTHRYKETPYPLVHPSVTPQLLSPLAVVLALTLVYHPSTFHVTSQTTWTACSRHLVLCIARPLESLGASGACAPLREDKCEPEHEAGVSGFLDNIIYAICAVCMG